jgi:hypothetical protein
VKIVLRSSRSAPIRGVEVDGKALTSFTGAEVTIDDVPSQIVLSY